MSDEMEESLTKFHGEAGEESDSSRFESKSASIKKHDDSNVKQGHVTTTTSSASQHEEDMIEKGVRFWTHPSLSNTPSEQKMEYLKSRGLTTKQIHDVWDRIVLADKSDNERMNGRVSDIPERGTHQNAMISSLVAPPPPFSHVDPPPYNAPYHEPHPSTTEDDALFVPTLLTIGGLLGITAAAAVRWLNGGDFCFFPGPTRGDRDCNNNTGETTVDQTELHQSTQEAPIESLYNQNREYELYNSVVEEEQDQSQQHSQELADTLESIVQTLQTHSSQQERILQQLSNQSTKQVTDQSMELLKYPGSHKKSREVDAMSRLMVWSKLVEIKSELTKLESNGQATDLSDRLERLLEDIESCLASLKVDETSLASHAGSSSDGSSQNHSETAASTPPGHYGAASFVETSSPLHSAIVQLATENEPSALQAGAKFLYLYILHLSSHPHVPRYRKIMTSNESFQRVEQLVGGKEVLLAVGFIERHNYLEWEPQNSDEVSDDDLTPLKEASAALSILMNQRQGDSSDTVLTSALAVLSGRASSPPPEAVMSVDVPDSQFQTPTNAKDFIVSPPTTKKLSLVEAPGSKDAPETPLSLLGDGIEDAPLDLSAISEQGQMDDALVETAAPNEDMVVETEKALVQDGPSSNAADSSDNGMSPVWDKPLLPPDAESTTTEQVTPAKEGSDIDKGDGPSSRLTEIDSDRVLQGK